MENKYSRLNKYQIHHQFLSKYVSNSAPDNPTNPAT